VKIILKFITVLEHTDTFVHDSVLRDIKNKMFISAGFVLTRPTGVHLGHGVATKTFSLASYICDKASDFCSPGKVLHSCRMPVQTFIGYDLGISLLRYARLRLRNQSVTMC
jgi:hypothetical protein